MSWSSFSKRPIFLYFPYSLFPVCSLSPFTLSLLFLSRTMNHFVTYKKSRGEKMVKWKMKMKNENEILNRISKVSYRV